MFDVGGGELIIIVLAIIVLFGPKKLPEIAQMFTKGMRQVRKAQEQFTTQINDLQREISKAADVNLESITSVKEAVNDLSDVDKAKEATKSEKAYKDIENINTTENDADIKSTL